MFGQRHCKTALQDISKLEENTDLMSKPQDGFVSRFLNRPISRRITSVLLKFPIHPSTWTISICVLPLIASVFLVRGDYVSIVIGAYQEYTGDERSEEHTSKLQSHHDLVCRLLLEKKKKKRRIPGT